MEWWSTPGRGPHAVCREWPWFGSSVGGAVSGEPDWRAQITSGPAGAGSLR